jgi:AcrR family transcriptional regulator
LDALRKPPRRASRTGPQFSRADPAIRRRLLVEAAIRCLARGGIAAFTVDNIRKEAKVSRGLLNHYFSSKDELLIEIYRASLYDSLMTLIGRTGPSRSAGDPDDRLREIVEANFAPAYFSRANVLVWLALWGEIAVNARLRATHRRLYDAYRKALAEAIAAVARKRRRVVDASRLSLSFISLIDGLWLEWCLNPEAISAAEARRVGYDLLESRLGTLAKVN